jgi:DNA polymerase-1
MLLSQMLHGTRRPKGFHSLEQVAAREISRTVSKAEQRSDWSDALTPEQLAYAAEDAAVLRGLHPALRQKVIASRQGRVAGIEARCLPALAWMTGAGVGFDRAAWDDLAAEAARKAETLANELDAAAPPRPGHPQTTGAWNWRSPQQVKQAFALLGVTLANTTDATLAAVNHPLAGLLRHYRSGAKLVSTYGTDWVKDAYHDGRLYPGWKQIGADSGRMSCSAPNAQNLPRDPRYRRCFVAPPGRLLIKADYSQIELRIAAKITRDRALLEAYERGEDLHARTAQRVLGAEEVTKEDRQLAKALGFGLLYGMGAKRFRDYAKAEYDLDLTLEDAEHCRAAFFAAYPGLAAWHRRVGASGDGAVQTRTLAGRRRAGVTRFSEKLNTPVQGTGADGLKLALALLWERRDQCPGAFPVLAVHDEIVVECGADQVEAVAAWVKAAMTEAMAPLIAPVPVEVEVKVGTTWGGD